ncbi:MAG: hypothetical protein JWN47_345 [Frankiales bacterium]|nr:hypothetical protein [Frankiales bacterium]
MARSKRAIETGLSHQKAHDDIEWLLSEIRPALGPNATVGDAALDRAVRANIARTVTGLRESHIVQAAVERREMKIVSMYYNPNSGVVEVISDGWANRSVSRRTRRVFGRN